MKRRTTTPLEARFTEIAERFAALTQVAYDGVLIYHAGLILNATSGAAALFGRAPQDLTQCHVDDLVTSESGPVLLEGPGTSRPVMALRGDGSRLPIEMSVQANLTFQGRRVQVVALRDASADDDGCYLTDREIARRRRFESVARN
jgi:hypothetical protein